MILYKWIIYFSKSNKIVNNINLIIYFLQLALRSLFTPKLMYEYNQRSHYKA